jgi:hypothetical protein
MWWAHPGFTRINIELTILTNGIEDHPEFWDARVACRNHLAFTPLRRQQLSTIASRLWVSLKR